MVKIMNNNTTKRHYLSGKRDILHDSKFIFNLINSKQMYFYSYVESKLNLVINT